MVVTCVIGLKAVPVGIKNERFFKDIDTIYYPVFTVHPFGETEGKSDFYHHLIEFKLSKEQAFRKHFTKEDKVFLKSK